MNFLIEALGWTLLHAVWQVAVVGAAAAPVLAMLRRAPASQRYLVACVALLASVLWPLAGLATRLGTELAYAADGGDAVWSGLAGVPVGWIPGLQAHLGMVVAAWLLCVLLLVLRSAMGLLWIRRTVREGAIDSVWQARLAQMAQHMGISRVVRLRVVGALASPLTAGWWRPVVLLPAALVSGMPPDLLEALLAHELAHVRRHDYLVNLLQNACETLLFYHPVVWWLSRRIRAERELIADELAAQHCGAPRRLAKALSELERRQFAAPAMALQACGGSLSDRIRRLVQPAPARSDWKAVALVLGLLGAGLFCTASATSQAVASPQVKPVVQFDSCAKPEWPQADLQAGHTGAVVLRFLIAADGSVTASRVLQSSGHPALDQAARDGIAKCHFKPGTVKGRPVAAWVRMQYLWQLQ